LSCRESRAVRRAHDAVGAQPAQQPEPVHAGHHHVEDDGVRADFTRLVKGGGPTGRGMDLESLELQAHREQFDDIGLVIDDEDPRLGGVLR
jgi:hypothetical protein